ncbi:hypothetical protein LZ198_13625 [Myxococcus sp. K15C18031901]|uniref:hypothetical protein n=1 Tax=Myxococcus dinghuensis TaxID=2906761 RepID=UPI0020A6FC31|nr:hypothetical protein [Myxococcus dinghuensis]MCP3099910.1 hypothetical protein [Myxococcus dinghuensis]
MHRSTLLSTCAALSLLACTERPPAPASNPDAAPSAVRPPNPPELDAGPTVVTPSTPDAGSVSDAGLVAADASTPGESCSAARLPPAPVKAAKPSVPAPTEAMRQRILMAARACDYAALATLANENGQGLRFTFGEGNDPVEYWRQAEARGEPVLARIAQVLELPDAKEGALYYWPSVHVTGIRNASDWKPLVGLYPEKQLRAMKKEGGTYYGLRVGITAEGDWQLAVQGD